jgi:hypothetical protein
VRFEEIRRIEMYKLKTYLVAAILGLTRAFKGTCHTRLALVTAVLTMLSVAVE